MAVSKFDLIVIGGGSGGLVCAAGGAGLGAKVALIEKKKLGGDCLNTGCVPSKALIRSAKIIHYFQKAQTYGVKKCDYGFDYSDIIRRVKEIQKKIEPHDSADRFRNLGIDVRFGEYHFKNPHEITNGEETLYGKRIVIATGSRPFIPPIPGCEEEKCLTTENIWDMTKLPQKLLVAGGGPIGSELSQCFARFGSEVTLLDMAPSILTREDPDMREFVQKSFEKDDIHMLFKVKIKKVEHGEYIHKVTYEKDGKDEEVVGNALFVSVGRRPNIENLKLENAQIQTSRTGIIINQYCQTSASHIYACGDVAGGYQFTHFADYQARLVLRNALFPGKAKADYRVVPWCTYTDPELARVGISEQEAQQKNISHDIFRYDLSQLDRAVCDSEGRGLVKVVTKKGKDKILGASIVGFHAGDLLQEYVFAMKQNLGLKHISSTIHPYPTMAEATRRASDEWMRSRLKPWIVKLFTWYFGMLF